jgi:DNA phosphorothioation-dependent restriction protein DptG
LIKFNPDKLEEVYKFQEKSFKHNEKKYLEVLPFTTNNKNIDDIYENFSDILSVICKNLIKKDIKNNFDKEVFFQKVNDLMIDSDNINRLKMIIQDLYFEEDNIINFNPKIYLYKEEGNLRIKDMGNFIFNILFYNLENHIFEEEKYLDDINVLEKLILNALESAFELKEINKKTNTKYKSLLPFVNEVFMEDIKFIMQDSKLFLENFLELIKLYYMFYCTQLVIKLDALLDTDLTKPSELYFNLYEEKISESRLGFSRGFKTIESKGRNLFAHVNTINFLNYAIEDEKIFSYTDIKNALENLESEDIKKESQNVDIISNRYKENLKKSNGEEFFDDMIFEPNDNELINSIYYFNSLVKHVFKNDQGKSGVANKYKNWIENFLRKHYSRKRGRYGSCLSLKREQLIFLTKICIKDKENIRLTSLFKEFERRGIFFDKKSKEETTNLFEKLNLLEKKSDSGDAKYVRRIL